MSAQEIELGPRTTLLLKELLGLLRRREIEKEPEQAGQLALAAWTGGDLSHVWIQTSGGRLYGYVDEAAETHWVPEGTPEASRPTWRPMLVAGAWSHDPRAGEARARN